MKNSNETSVNVIIECLSSHPKCQHGPTLLFSLKKSGSKYFACSCSRDLKFCPFKLDYKEFLSGKWKERVKFQQTSELNHSQLTFLEVRNQNSVERIYCKKCGIFLKSKSQHENHDLLENISDLQLKEPVLHLLTQLDNDKKEAQYFFNLESLNLFYHVFKQLKLNKIICIGAPRLHEFLKAQKSFKVQSILLDIDSRLRSFNDPGEFCHYNMFNNFFFDSTDEKKLEEFMLEREQDNVCLFTDPPFAARTEPLIFTIKKLANTYNKLNQKILPIFWIFPYFMEKYVTNNMPEMEMMDYQVNYINHKNYNEDSKARKEGSPVRIFSNVDQRLIKFPSTESNYKFCSKCHRFVFNANKHCNICQICPSKNGATYQHCKQCCLCVKPTYKHCFTCSRCTSLKNHNCKEFQKHQECWLCRKLGHVEKKCPLVKKLRLKKIPGHCLLCGQKKSHNLRNCPSRSWDRNLDNIS